MNNKIWQSEKAETSDIFKEASFFVFHSIKGKSWSVMLVKGYILNDKVRAERCENCKSLSQVLTNNFNNPNLTLYGCKDTKCKHKLLRLDFKAEGPPKLLVANAAQ